MSWNLPIQISRLKEEIDNKTDFSQLSVSGNSTFLSNLNVAGVLTATTSVSVVSLSTNVSILNVSGTTKLNGPITGLSSLNISGNTFLDNDLYLPKLSGASALNLALSTDNNGKVITTTVGGTLLSALYVSGNSTLQSNLLVSGTTILQDLNTKNITGFGNLTISGNSNIIGASTFNSTLNISGNTIIENNLIIKQAQTNLSSLNVSGSTRLENSLTVQNNLGGTANPVLKVNSNNSTAPGAYIELYHNSSAPSVNDRTGVLTFWGNNTSGTKIEYGRIRNRVKNTSSVSGASEFTFYTQKGGIDERFKIDGDGITTTASLYVSGSTVLESNLLVKQAQTNLSSLDINNNLRVSGSSIINQNLTLSSITNASVLGTNSNGQIVASSSPSSLPVIPFIAGNQYLVASPGLTTSLSTVTLPSLYYDPNDGVLMLDKINTSGDSTMLTKLTLGPSRPVFGDMGILDVSTNNTTNSTLASFRTKSNFASIVFGNSDDILKAGEISYVSQTSQILIGGYALGEKNLYLNCSGNTNIGVGTNNPLARLHISGTAIIDTLTTTSSLTVSGAQTNMSTLNVSGNTLINSILSVGTEGQSSIIRRGSSNGSFGLVLSGGHNLTSTSNLALDTNFGASIVLSSGNPLTDPFGGAVSINSWGSTNPTSFGNTITFNRRSANNTLSESMRIASNGRVGIGSTNPQNSLEVNGGVRFTLDNTPTKSIQLNYNTARDGGSIYAVHDGISFKNITFPYANTGFGENVTSPSNIIDVRFPGNTSGASTSALRFGDNNGTGILGAGSSSAGMYNSAFNGFIRVLQGSTGLESSGTITNVSDERIKEDIKDITEDPINIINQIRPVEYHHKLDPPNKITHGLIAQEVEKIIPCAVEQRKLRLSEDIEFEDGRALDYNCVNMFHIKATQQLIKLVNQLKLKVEILENEVKLLKNEI